MTVSTFTSSTADGMIESSSTTYATAAAGNALSVGTSVTDTSFAYAGQIFSSPTYFIEETFYQFDTSSIPDSDTISAAVFSLYGHNDESTTNFIVQARLHDWGAALTTADWVAQADLSSKTLLATFDIGAVGSWNTGAYNDFTSDANFISNVSKTGVTYILVCSNRHVGLNTPSNSERVSAHYADNATAGFRPKLVVTHSSTVSTRRLQTNVTPRRW